MKENRTVFDMEIKASPDQRSHCIRHVMPKEISAVLLKDGEDPRGMMMKSVTMTEFTTTLQRIVLGEEIFSIRIPDFLTQMTKEILNEEYSERVFKRDSKIIELKKELRTFEKADVWSRMRYLFTKKL